MKSSIEMQPIKFAYERCLDQGLLCSFKGRNKNQYSKANIKSISHILNFNKINSKILLNAIELESIVTVESWLDCDFS